MLKDLIFATPESHGVASLDILKFIRYVEENKINLHSFLFATGGEIIAEGYFPPFNESFLHRLYSASKTYVGLAVGMLVTEGKLSTGDRVLDFFPEYDTDDVPELMRRCTVEDALTMSTPRYAVRASEKPEPMENPYAAPCDKPAGTIFNYGDGNAICTAIVERVSGMYLMDYMRPLLDKIGVGKDTRCIKDYDGRAWGGSGILSTLRDFAKVAELVGSRGKHGTEQLIDREYMEKMTSVRTSAVSANFYSRLSTAGYGYQTWISPEAVCMRGMGCQEAYYFTDRDLLFVCNGDTMTDYDFSDTRIYDAIKYLIYENMSAPRKAEGAYGELREKLSSLNLPRYGEAHSPTEEEISGVCYSLEKNAMGWSCFSINIGDGEGVITYSNTRGEKSIRFGLGSYLKSTFPETHYYDEQRGVPSGRELDCLAIGEWIERDKLLIRVYITDVSFGSVFALIAFKDGMAALQFKKRGEFILDDYGGTALGTRVESK